MRKLLFIGSISLFLTACNANVAVNSNVNTNASAKNTNTAVIEDKTANTNKTENTNAAKLAESGPKRISFAKGKIETTETITLAPGESLQFVVGAKKDQRFDLTLSSKEVNAKILKGKAGELYDMDDAKEKYYQSVVDGDGDIVFEIKNPTKKEIKTSVKVWIDINGG